jgi:hypothetical protein
MGTDFKIEDEGVVVAIPVLTVVNRAVTDFESTVGVVTNIIQHGTSVSVNVCFTDPCKRPCRITWQVSAAQGQAPSGTERHEGNRSLTPTFSRAEGSCDVCARGHLYIGVATHDNLAKAAVPRTQGMKCCVDRLKCRAILLNRFPSTMWKIHAQEHNIRTS